MNDRGPRGALDPETCQEVNQEVALEAGLKVSQEVILLAIPVNRHGAKAVLLGLLPCQIHCFKSTHPVSVIDQELRAICTSNSRTISTPIMRPLKESKESRVDPPR